MIQSVVAPKSNVYSIHLSKTMCSFKIIIIQSQVTHRCSLNIKRIFIQKTCINHVLFVIVLYKLSKSAYNHQNLQNEPTIDVL